MVVLSSDVFSPIPENRFRISVGDIDFTKQYSQVYTARLAAGKPTLLKLVKKFWDQSTNDSDGKHVPVCSLADLNVNEKCIIVGTIYKEMRLKPSILREMAVSEMSNGEAFNEPGCNGSNWLARLATKDDIVFLEDEIQRISLSFTNQSDDNSCTIGNLATGVLAAVLGLEPQSQLGTFEVEKMLFLEPQPQRPIRKLPSTFSYSLTDYTSFRTTGPWLGFVCGLGFTDRGSVKRGHSMSVQLLADWLRCMGDPSGSNEYTNKPGLVRLMILGDSIKTDNADEDQDFKQSSQRARYLTRHTEASSVTAMACFDEWLASLPIGRGLVSNDEQNGIQIDLLPGSSDPTSQLMPQQPIHPTVLPLARARSIDGIRGRTNPFSCVLAGRRILATSGQAIDDLYRYTLLQDSCDCMEATLLWGHLAPTCPDTLVSYPFKGEDPLLLRFTDGDDPFNVRVSPDYPDIYAAGCQSVDSLVCRRARLHWASEDRDGALLVAVPRFDQSRSLVLIHLETMDCVVVKFDVTTLDEDVPISEANG